MALVFKITDSKGRKKIIADNSKVSTPKKVNDEETKEFKSVDSAKKEEETQFTKEEVKLLKSLLEYADDLLKIVAPKDDKKKDEEKQDDTSLEEEFEFTEEEETKETKDEDVVNLPDENGDDTSSKEVTEDGLTDVDEELEEVKSESKTVAHDSKSSFGSIETKDSVNDSKEISQEEINAAWAKRLGGRK